MRRGDISHGELSERLGDVTERCLARYIAGKSHLLESEFREVAKALSMDAQVLAGAWASSVGLRASGKDAVRWISVLWIQRLEKNQLHTNYTIRRLDQVARALGVELMVCINVRARSWVPHLG